VPKNPFFNTNGGWKMTDTGFGESGKVSMPGFEELVVGSTVLLDKAGDETMKKWLSSLILGTVFLGTYGALAWIVVEWVNKI
jgi:hypothetical protein